MRYLSLFSGIESATAAWHSLGWTPVAFAEIEPFPCAVLAHHYPDVPNLGDVTKITERQILALGSIDLVVFGSPCQDLSVAGKRAGLKGKRSGLFFDAMRIVRWSGARFAIFENVPGLFSSNSGRDFAVVVGEMAGMEFDVPVDGWRNAGVALGKDGLVEWSVLDAQFFGVPQRRRRIFALADFGDWRSRPPILLECESLRGHHSQGGEARKDVAPTISARTKGGGGLGTDFDCDGGLIASTGDVSHCLDAGGMHRIDYETETLIAPTLRAGGNRTGGDRPPGTDVDTCESLIVTHSLRAEGFDASEDGTGRGIPLVPIPILEAGARTGKSTTDVRAGIGIGEPGDPMFTLQSGKQHAIAFNNTGQGWWGESSVAQSVRKGNDAGGGGARESTLVAFSCKDYGDDAGDVAPTLRSMGHDGSHANAGGQVAVAFNLRGRENGSQPEVIDVASLRSASGGSSRSYVATHGGNSYVYAKKAGPVTALRVLREEVGEEALCVWSLGMLVELQSSNILRSALHGGRFRPATFSRSWLVYCALSCSKDDPMWLLQSLREAECKGCPPQGWEPSKQLTGQLGTYLSELSQPGAQVQRLMYDLWESSEGSGLLRQALSTFQKMGQSIVGEGQSVRCGEVGSRPEPTPQMCCHGMPDAPPLEGLLRPPRDAVTARQPSAVRRLLPTECEALMGLPRGYTDVPYRGKKAADGPRYRSLGNSMAVPVLHYIGQRIQLVEDLINGQGYSTRDEAA